jgi:hypothetical protein
MMVYHRAAETKNELVAIKEDCGCGGVVEDGLGMRGKRLGTAGHGREVEDSLIST